MAIAAFGGTDPGSEFSDSRAHGIFIALVLAVWAAAVCLVNAGTFRLRRRGVYTAGFVDALFTPVRYRAVTGYHQRREREVLPEWLLRLLFGVAVLVGLAVTLSNQVNAVAYLTDSTPTAVFVPRSYVQDCGKDGCATTTAGILEGSGLPAVWPSGVPLDRAFIVHAPVWRTGSSPTLMTSESAVGYTLLAMIVNATAAQHAIRPHPPSQPAAETTPTTAKPRPARLAPARLSSRRAITAPYSAANQPRPSPISSYPTRPAGITSRWLGLATAAARDSSRSDDRRQR